MITALGLTAALALSVALPAHAEGGFLGVGLEAVNGSVRIRKVIKDSPAEKADLRVGDVVRRIDKKETKTPDDVTKTVATHSAKERVTLTVTREGKEKAVVVTLGERVRAENLRDKFFPALDIDVIRPNDSARADLVKTASFKGDVALVYVFATWCGSCRATVPEINAWQAKFAPRGYRTIGIGVDGKAPLVSYLEDSKLAFPAGVAEDASHRLGIDAIPSLFLIDRRGVVRDVVVGGDPAALNRLSTTIARLLDEPRSLDAP